MEQAGKEYWVRNTLLLGGALGAITGVGLAYLMVRKAQSRDEYLKLTSGEGLRLGLLLMGLMRSVAELGEGEKK